MILQVCSVCKSPWVQETACIEVNTGLKLQTDSIYCPHCGDKCELESVDYDVYDADPLDRAMKELDRRHKRVIEEVRMEKEL